MTDPLVPSKPLGLNDVLALDRRGLHAIVEAAAPLDLDALADTSYTGIDLARRTYKRPLVVTQVYLTSVIRWAAWFTWWL
jgi:hypothetical protein